MGGVPAGGVESASVLEPFKRCVNVARVAQRHTQCFYLEEKFTTITERLSLDPAKLEAVLRENMELTVKNGEQDQALAEHKSLLGAARRARVGGKPMCTSLTHNARARTPAVKARDENTALLEELREMETEQRWRAAEEAERRSQVEEERTLAGEQLQNMLKDLRERQDEHTDLEATLARSEQARCD